MKERMYMRNDLMKYANRGCFVELIYLSKTGEFSKRKVKLFKVQGDTFYAYCFKQNARRTFRIDHVLALIPIHSKESGVV